MIKELTLKHLTIPTINLCKRYNCENNEIVTFIHNTSNLHSLFKFGAIPSCVWAVYRNSCSHHLRFTVNKHGCNQHPKKK